LDGSSLETALLTVRNRGGYYASNTYRGTPSAAQVEQFKRDVLDPVLAGSDLTGRFLGDQKGIEECKLAPSQHNMAGFLRDADINKIVYCVHLGHTWWAIPKNAVVLAPNRLGPAIVWPLFADEKTKFDEYGDPELTSTKLRLQQLQRGPDEA
jgi:hypothetical protein